MADSMSNLAATGSATAAAVSNTTNLDRVVVDALLQKRRLFDNPSVHHTEAQLADDVARIIADLGPNSTADSLAEDLKRIRDGCLEAEASLSQEEHQVPQEMIDRVANLLPLLRQEITLQEKIGLLQVTYKASSRAIEVLAYEKAQYLRNMRMFHQVLQGRLSDLQAVHGSMHIVGAFIGNGVLETSNKLWLLAGDSPEERVNDKYLVDIQRYWRRFSGKEAARGFEDGWVYLADCELTWEY